MKHLLSMTSGIPGEAEGILGMAVGPGRGEFEFALGKVSNRPGASAATLSGQPWDYSDAGFAHLSLIFAKVAGREIGSYMRGRVFTPIGMPNFGWDLHGGAGILACIRMRTADYAYRRVFARLGYLLAHHGLWEGKQIVPDWWIELATRSSQNLNRSYGYTFWVNNDDAQWPTVAKDASCGKRRASVYSCLTPGLIINRDNIPRSSKKMTNAFLPSMQDKRGMR